ncbi:MAG TPA: glycosyltransferase family 39 protein, partial [Pirellulales bacterium]
MMSDYQMATMPLLNTSPRCWREWQFWVLAAITAVIYLSRIVDLPIRGEETRRAMVAWEIVQSGDWIVPQQQHQPFLSRPPVGSWPIAWLTEASGDLSIFAVRLPSIAATILVTLLIYAYARQFLSRLGALSSGLAFATFVQVLQLGRLAETEALFTL